jgi:large subunit ribosomal protein L15
MALKKTHKRAKYSRAHGRGMGTAGTGSRKNAKKSGHHGGCGMAGTGKRADQKKTLINKLYGNDYFGKQGITSKGTKRDKRDRINLASIGNNLIAYLKKGLAKKTAKGYEINLKSYKILGTGEVKEKLFITALSASKSAIEKVNKAGGELILKESSDEDEEEWESSEEEKE